MHSPSNHVRVSTKNYKLLISHRETPSNHALLAPSPLKNINDPLKTHPRTTVPRQVPPAKIHLPDKRQNRARRRSKQYSRAGPSVTSFPRPRESATAARPRNLRAGERGFKAPRGGPRRRLTSAAQSPPAQGPRKQAAALPAGTSPPPAYVPRLLRRESRARFTLGGPFPCPPPSARCIDFPPPSGLM